MSEPKFGDMVEMAVSGHVRYLMYVGPSVAYAPDRSVRFVVIKPEFASRNPYPTGHVDDWEPPGRHSGISKWISVDD
jgi:hypothetical protein